MTAELVPAPLRALTTITCQGRGIDHTTGASIGEPCGAAISTHARHHHSNLLDTARAHGWRIGHRNDGTPDAMCPRCAKPDPITVAHCRDLARSVQP